MRTFLAQRYYHCCAVTKQVVHGLKCASNQEGRFCQRTFLFPLWNTTSCAHPKQNSIKTYDDQKLHRKVTFAIEKRQIIEYYFIFVLQSPCSNLPCKSDGMCVTVYEKKKKTAMFASVIKDS